MTKVASHLMCDCKKAVHAFSCPVGILKPTVKHSYNYYHCSYCGYDYICDHSIRISFEYDEKGLPKQNKIVCSRCGTPLEVYEWPMKVEDIKEEGVYKSKYASIYKKSF
ncbi:MAG: hypothetical protein ACTSX6_12010 [Candidatus Heimdallarchaeaceae archaeon]